MSSTLSQSLSRWIGVPVCPAPDPGLESEDVLRGGRGQAWGDRDASEDLDALLEAHEAKLGKRQVGAADKTRRTSVSSTDSGLAERKRPSVPRPNPTSDDELPTQTQFLKTTRLGRKQSRSNSATGLSAEEMAYTVGMLEKLWSGQLRMEEKIDDMGQHLASKQLIETLSQDMKHVRNTLMESQAQPPVSPCVTTRSDLVQEIAPPDEDASPCLCQGLTRQRSEESNKSGRRMSVSSLRSDKLHPTLTPVEWRNAESAANESRGGSHQDDRRPASRSISVHIEAAELPGQHESTKLWCTLALDGVTAVETHAEFGSRPNWSHKSIVKFNQEEAMTFTVEFEDSVGTLFPLGSATLYQHQFTSAFSGWVDLLDQGEDVVGQLLVSSTPQFQTPRRGSTCSANTERTCVSSNASDYGGIRRMSVASADRYSSASHYSSARNSIRWPATLNLRDNLKTRRHSIDDGMQHVHNAVRSNLQRSLSKALEDSVKDSIALSSERSGSFFECKRRRKFQYWTFLRKLPFGICCPTSKKMLAYDVLSLLILLHDMVTIPVVLAWDVSNGGWYGISALVSFLFWLFDMGMSFATGYFADGQIVMDWESVVRHYIRTWFWLDAPLVFVDLVSAIVAVAAVGDWGKRTTILRYLRLVCLLRTWRLLRTFANVIESLIENYFSSNAFSAFSYIVLLVVLILWIGHAICCIWYAIGKSASSGTGFCWFDTVDFQGAKFEDTPWGYQYTTAFHWALAQLSGSGVEAISPMNAFERSFNISICIFQILFGTFLVSSLSATMVDVQISKQDKLVKIREVRQFLAQNSIDHRLAIRVQKQVSDRLWMQKQLQADEVPALNMLSNKLRIELTFAIIGPHLLKHPLYSLCASIDEFTVQHACAEACSQIVAPAGESIFNSGTDAQEAFLLVSGSIAYSQSPVTCNYLESEVIRPVEEGQWLCVATLWTHWQHVGSAEATASCELLSVKAVAMLDVCLKHPIVGDIFREYGSSFHRKLVASQPPYADFPSDIDVGYTSYKEMVLSMRSEIKTVIGMVALSKLRNRHDFSWYGSGPSIAEHLERELHSGKCTILTNDAGVAERVVALSVLRAESSNGAILAQVGKYVQGKVACKCCLPSALLEDGELFVDAMDRMISTALTPFMDFLVWDTQRRPRQEKENKPSQAFGINTEYIRTIHFATVNDGMDCDFIPAGARTLTLGARKNDLMQHEISSAVTSYALHRDSSYYRHPTVHQDLLPIPVFAITNSSRGQDALFAWLPERIFEKYSVPSKHQEVQKWLEMFEPPRRNSAAASLAGCGEESCSIGLC